MKYTNDSGLWSRMRSAAQQYGKNLEELDEVFGLDEGMLEYMAENDVIPEDELLRRFSLFAGLSREQLLAEEPDAPRLDVRRTLFVLRGAEFVKDYTPIEGVIGRVFVDRPQSDPHSYVCIKVESDSMCRAHIFRGDIVFMRRQAMAEDGNIVVATVDGKSMIRRFHRKNDVIWLIAEGPADDGPVECSDYLKSMERRIIIRGVIMSTTRLFDESEIMPIL